jgi:hypothetical protein
MDQIWTSSLDRVAARDSAWINGRRWDVMMLIGSALIVPVVLVCMWAGASSDFVNLGVTAIIGGPHLFATYVATYLDPRFRRSHWWVLVAASVLVPAFVIYSAIHHFQVLMSIFIFAASFHVLQQNAFLTDVYRKRAAQRDPWWSRFVDYALLFVCIYPGASYKLVNGTFYLGEIKILIPELMMVKATYWTVWLFFGVFLVVWSCKTFVEWRRGEMNGPKTLLIAVTTVIAFSIPWMASKSKLELAFQSINAWHSIQYLGLVWYIQKVRKDRGLLEGRIPLKIAGSGRAAWYYYGFCFGVTMLLVGTLVPLAKTDPIGGLSFSQYYYMGVLSFLLIHYVLDAYLFAVGNRESSTVDEIPYAAPALIREDVAPAE